MVLFTSLFHKSVPFQARLHRSWLVALALLLLSSPSWAATYKPADAGPWPGQTKSTVTVTANSRLVPRTVSMYPGKLSLGGNSFESGVARHKASTITLSSGSIVYSFSPAIPAKEIGIVLFEMAFPKGTISISGGATLADFKLDQWVSPPYTHMKVNGANWAAVQSGGSSRPQDSTALWVGSGNKLVSKITISYSGDRTGDSWYAGVAYRKCVSSSECPSSLPLCNSNSGVCVKPYTSGGHSANWIFGNNCVMKWDTSGKLTTSSKPPASFKTGEGCSVYSDPKSGDLIIYSDGRNVWNGKGQKINTTSLYGNSSAINSALIVPAPGEPGRYTIFSGYSGVGALYYTKFDMRTAPGKQVGNPIKINSSLRYGEGQAITQRKDGQGFWHVSGYLNKLYIATLTKNGLSKTKVVTLGGNYVSEAHGPIGFSHDGKYLVTSRGYVYSNQQVVRYNFNTETGTISNETKLGTISTSRLYGIEFSPDNTKLYISDYAYGLYQFDLSKTGFPLTKLTGSATGHIRLALDGKIYGAGRGSNMHVIESPNSSGTAAKLKVNAFSISGCTPSLSLPSVISSKQQLTSASCGNGLIDSGEQCDDGNQIPNDGCSTSCKIEPGYTCQNSGSLTIQNGSFEQGKTGRFNPNSSNIPGWKIGGQQVDIFPFGSSGVWATHTSTDGLQTLDLDGNRVTSGLVYQDVSTTKGTTYTIQFRVAANCHADGYNPSCSSVIREAEVSVANGSGAPFKKQMISSNINGIGTSGVSVGKNWPTVTFTFTAQGPLTRLQFRSLSKGKKYAGYGVMLDDIKGVTSTCVPKPYTCPTSGSAKASDLVYVAKTADRSTKSSFPSNLFQVEQKTNKITLIGQFTNNGKAIFVDGLAMNKAGQLYGFSYDPSTGKSRLVLINRKNATTTNVGPELGFLVNGAAFNQKDELWVSAISSAARDIMNLTNYTLGLTRINAKTGVAVKAPTSFTLNGQDLKVDNRVVDISFSASGSLLLTSSQRLYQVTNLNKPTLRLLRSYSGDSLMGITVGPNSCEGHGIDGDGPDNLRVLSLADATFSSVGTFSGANAGGGDAARAPIFCGGACLDKDNDGILDALDKDSDNDGIPDTRELGGKNLAGDSDKDGIPDYKDSSVVTCTDTTPKDGICDKLPASVDADGDGIPNHLDLDSDNDGIPDIVEAGGTDTNNDGRIDGFTDTNNDGLHDPLATKPLTVRNSDNDSTPDFLDTDSDNDTVSDTTEAGGADANKDGRIDGFTDTNKDGLHDPLTSSPLPLPDADGDKAPNYRDTCADGRKTGAEACDDGNGKSNDGCSSTCKVEPGYTCKGGDANSPTKCTKDNVAPTITGTPSLAATQDQKYSFKPGVSDPDSAQTHTWRSVKTLPKGATLNTATGEISWTPTNAQAGKSYEFEIEVCDNGTPKKCARKAWKVTVKNVNDKPQITNTPGTEIVFGNSYTYKPAVTDPDVGDTFTYKLTTTATGAKVDPTTGEVTWTPKAGDVGKTFDFELEVCDSGTPKQCVKKTWKVKVTTTNSKPSITSTAPTEAFAYKEMTYEPKATDPNSGDKLTWKLKKGPAGAKVDPTTGKLTWTPKAGDVGKDFEFEIEVCDDGKPPMCVSQTFKVTVKDLACGVDNDCPNDLVCLQGKCALPNCYMKSATCKTGELCVEAKCNKDDCANKTCGKDEFCRPTDNKCVKSCFGVKCAAGKMCKDGTCVDDPCANKKCAAGQVCVAGTCVKERCKESNACRHGRLCQPEQNACVDDLCKGVKCPNASEVCKYGQCVLKDECMFDDDCKDDNLCVKGKCVKPTCGSQNACGEDKVCVDGTCADNACKGKTCDKNKFCKAGVCVDTCASITCKDGEVCQEGKCVSDPCDSKKCADGEVCKAGTCVRDRCRKDACKDGRLCKVDRCEDDPCNGIQCPAGLTCNKGQCTGTRTCEIDSDCPGELVCLDGKCAEPGCYTKPCSDGKVCQKGKCVDNPCDSAKCAEDEVCRPSDGQCIKLCPKCAEGQVCKDGQCEDDPCKDVNCKDGEICIDGSCQPDPCAKASGEVCRHKRVCKAKQDKASCDDDPCAKLTCPNGGTCKGGVCEGSKPAEEKTEESTKNQIESTKEMTEESASKDAGNAQDDAANKDQFVAGGCGCSGTNPSFPVFFLFLLLVLWTVARRR